MEIEYDFIVAITKENLQFGRDFYKAEVITDEEHVEEDIVDASETTMDPSEVLLLEQVTIPKYLLKFDKYF